MLDYEIHSTWLKSESKCIPSGMESPMRSVKVSPPFGYYGAKHRLSSQIVKFLPPHNAWIEAFCGSAAITLAKKPAPIEIINDLDGEIVNLFLQLREAPEQLCQAVSLTPYARDELNHARISTAAASPLERARRFLIATMMAVNGSVGSPDSTGFSTSPSYTRSRMEARVSRWYNLPDRLALVAERLRGVRIENQDAVELIESFSDRPATLLYLDPPYLMKRSHCYSFDANEGEFHRRLLEACNRSRAMIVISSYENDLYNELLTEENGWARNTIETHTRGTNGKNKPRLEVLWENSASKKARETNKIPIRLSQKEKDQKKVNPSRKALMRCIP